MLNLNHLQVISTICETGSFQAASEKLNKARPAVSYTVKQVEERYQIQIFDRSKYRPELTPEGKQLLGRIRGLLRQAQDLEDFFDELKGETEHELRLGVSSVFPTQKLSGLLKSLRQNFPSTTIHLEFEVGAGERILRAEKVDLAIFAVAARQVDLDYKHLETMDLPLVINADLIQVQAAEVSREDLALHPQVVVKSPDEQSPDFGLLDQAPKWFVSELAAKKDLICDGLGWGRLPRHMVANELAGGQLVELATLGQISLPICLAKRSDHSLGPVGTHLWNFFDPA